MRATTARAVRGASAAVILLVATGCQLAAAPWSTTATGTVVAVVDGDTIDVQTEL